MHVSLSSTRLRKLFALHERLDTLIATSAGKAGKAGKRVRRDKAKFERALQACSRVGLMGIFLSGIVLMSEEMLTFEQFMPSCKRARGACGAP